MTDTPKPSARTGRKFLSLGPEQVAALEALGKRFGCDAGVMANFLRSALTPKVIDDLIEGHLMSAGKGTPR